MGRGKAKPKIYQPTENMVSAEVAYNMANSFKQEAEMLQLKLQSKEAAVRELVEGLKIIRNGYQDDGMEQMGPRDDLFYQTAATLVGKYGTD